ncbi:hypothetical protein BXZ70DRAFT_929671 [Cristinia sonorae]|uniref:Uncharacterized protein n=1 Tax=Cristinia sonorae TaxID=1940300 RepID=A0A8K0US18_9AGAR|nr:hypothetical protein BXZ70DRAFT_929671 [Cristinia sonorae]
MFFSKVAIVAALGLATAVAAHPHVVSVDVEVPAVGIPPIPAVPGVVSVAKRNDVVLGAVQNLVGNVAPVIDTLNKATSKVDVDNAVATIVDLFNAAEADINTLLGVDVDIDIQAIVAAVAQLVGQLVSAISVKDILDLSILGKIDAALGGFVGALTKVKADIGADLLGALPVNVDVFGTLNLVLTGHVLDVVQIPSLDKLPVPLPL